ncbi:Sporulation related domain-containing protein [Desulfacinum infernum DSM 9756]|uniref:Sporulation related domain-containing protein n=1 Tax=Desulfacinum infernum DSM 9756 TaxID=1121391 RepID=A0A1M4VFD9_9BACT|nr:SPOR domain-containing protein [Desulfacinum infernum]SHE67726.1 Sporulation related domain-containing protein [Desulfacinum infernum DSM 9756]
MARSKAHPSGGGTKKDSPRARLVLQLTFGQCVVCALVFLVCLAWIFLAGVLVGRSSSPHGAPASWMPKGLAHLMGLDHTPPEPDPNAADTWLPPEKILEELQFEKTLPGVEKSQGGPSPAPAARPEPAPGVDSSGGAEPAEVGEAPESGPPEGAYVLMVASMRRRENALSLADRLTKKGYRPQVEKVSMGEGDLWYRVTLGSFPTREEALAFAARFNREENLEALVIQKEGPAGSSP